MTLMSGSMSVFVFVLGLAFELDGCPLLVVPDEVIEADGEDMGRRRLTSEA